MTRTRNFLYSQSRITLLIVSCVSGIFFYILWSFAVSIISRTRNTCHVNVAQTSYSRLDSNFTIGMLQLRAKSFPFSFYIILFKAVYGNMNFEKFTIILCVNIIKNCSIMIMYKHNDNVLQYDIIHNNNNNILNKMRHIYIYILYICIYMYAL